MELSEEDVLVLAFIAGRVAAHADGDVTGFEIRQKFTRSVDLSRLLDGFIEQVSGGPLDEHYKVTLAGAKLTPLWDALHHAAGVALSFMKRSLEKDPRKQAFEWPELLADVKHLDFGVLKMALPLFGFPLSMWGPNTFRWDRAADILDVLDCSTADDLLALRERQAEALRERQRAEREREQRQVWAEETHAFGAATQPNAGRSPAEERQVSNTAFVIQGHDQAVIDALEDFLRRIGLSVKLWEGSVRDTGLGGSPHNDDVFAAGIEKATVVVALFTPDDYAAPRPGAKTGSPRFQPRPNVILETGWALRASAAKVVIVEVGMTHSISDLDGRNTIRMPSAADDPTAVHMLNKLASRLETIGASIDRTDHRWNDPTRCAALFSPVPTPPTSSGAQAPAPGSEFDGLPDETLTELLKDKLPDDGAFITFAQLDAHARMPAGTAARVGEAAARAADRFDSAKPGGIRLKPKGATRIRDVRNPVRRS